ncbi:MAG: hypothetical protein QG582_1453, partial [Candidatus Thermoplasmatota archaeon]|nr:hypothetical protein [Candidatus Thermoplasmatota archaeon]
MARKVRKPAEAKSEEEVRDRKSV